MWTGKWLLMTTVQVINFASVKDVPVGSPSSGGNVAVYVLDINQLSLPTPFYSVLVSFSVFMALSLWLTGLKALTN